MLFKFMRFVTAKISCFLLLAFLFAIPRLVFASGLESFRADLTGLYAAEQTLQQTSQKLKEKAGLLSEKIAAQKPETGEPGLSQRNQLENFLKESKQIETDLGRIETQLDSVRERIRLARENLLAGLSLRIAALEKQSRKKPDSQQFADLLGLRREKENLLDQVFSDLNPRIVLPAAGPGDGPQEIRNKLEVLDLARSHLQKQLEVTIMRLEELNQQLALSRGLQEFLEDTYDFSAEVSHRDEILARVQNPPDTSLPSNPAKESPGNEGIAIIDFGDTGKDSLPSSVSPPEILRLQSSSSTLSLPAGSAHVPTLEEKILRWKTRKTALMELILRVNARGDELRREQ
jgi:archaellum component FlaC